MDSDKSIQRARKLLMNPRSVTEQKVAARRRNRRMAAQTLIRDGEDFNFTPKRLTFWDIL